MTHYSFQAIFCQGNNCLPSNKRVRDLEITKDMVERRDLSLCLLEKAG
jgi:hypothetical protein